MCCIAYILPSPGLYFLTHLKYGIKYNIEYDIRVGNLKEQLQITPFALRRIIRLLDAQSNMRIESGKQLKTYFSLRKLI